MSENSVKY
jgi:hypothetical protein